MLLQFKKKKKDNEVTNVADGENGSGTGNPDLTCCLYWYNIRKVFNILQSTIGPFANVVHKNEYPYFIAPSRICLVNVLT